MWNKKVGMVILISNEENFKKRVLPEIKKDISD
jgi:hypothetical protein